MHLVPARVRNSPALVRALPFVLFVLLTAIQPYAGRSGAYWIYLIKTVLAGAMLWSVASLIPELRWSFSWEAAVVGVGVFVLWIKLGDLIQAVGLGWFGQWRANGESWNPLSHYGSGSVSGMFFTGVRLTGSTFIVPPMEEVFYRSFVYRYLQKPDFESVPLGRFSPFGFFATSLLFGFEHREWLAGILCGLAYQGLVCWKGRLRDAITAHAITNALLGCWVIGKGQWQFW
jgi:CAAX prenyl protease-like protein